MNAAPAPADRQHHSGERAVHAPSSAPGSTASSPACLARRRGVTRAVAAGCRGADAGRADRRQGRRRRRRRAPWHDQTMPLAERMKLAEGRPLRRRMMAAMAQQDCGQCGYNCEDYSDAIFAKKEERLNLCVPGGKETARMLKTLYEEIGARAGPLRRQRRPPPSRAADAGRRRRAARATIRPRRRSCRARGSTSRAPRRRPGTSSSISPTCGLDYAVGDAFGVFPTQRSGAGRCGARGARRAAGFPDRRPHAARGADRRRVARARARHAVPAVLLHHRRRAAAEGEGAGRGRGPRRRRRDASTCWRRSRNSPACGPIPEAFIEALDPLQPRLYSISSSPKVDPGRVALTVDAVRYDIDRPHAARRRLDLPRRPRRARRPAQGLCAEGACASACRPIRRCRSS